MPRRRLVPFALVGVLAVLALVFAVVGVAGAPDTASLTVQNATAATFGSPAGTTSFSLNLIDALAAVKGGASISQTRLVTYSPHRMIVYEVASTGTKRLAVLGAQGSTCALSAYTTIVGGPVAWTSTGHGTFTRHESLGAYAGRVPYAAGTTCSPRPSTVHGSVGEVATVKSGYLVTLRLFVTVPPQTLANGSAAAHGVEGEELNLLKINGTPTSSLSP